MTTSHQTNNHANPIDILTDDHNRVTQLFMDFEKIKKENGSDQEKLDIVKKICTELKIHTQIEEEVFYPDVRKALKDDDLMDEANVEHLGAKNFIFQLESMQPSDHYYDAKVKVLGENIAHHVKEEEEKMFPKVKKAHADTSQLAHQLEKRKEELQHAFSWKEKDA